MADQHAAQRPKPLGSGSSIRTVAYGTKPSPKSLFAKVYGTRKP